MLQRCAVFSISRVRLKLLSAWGFDVGFSFTGALSGKLCYSESHRPPQGSLSPLRPIKINPQCTFPLNTVVPECKYTFRLIKGALDSHVYLCALTWMLSHVWRKCCEMCGGSLNCNYYKPINPTQPRVTTTLHNQKYYYYY